MSCDSENGRRGPSANRHSFPVWIARKTELFARLLGPGIGWIWFLVNAWMGRTIAEFGIGVFAFAFR